MMLWWNSGLIRAHLRTPGNVSECDRWLVNAGKIGSSSCFWNSRKMRTGLIREICTRDWFKLECSLWKSMCNVWSISNQYFYSYRHKELANLMFWVNWTKQNMLYVLLTDRPETKWRRMKVKQWNISASLTSFRNHHLWGKTSKLTIWSRGLGNNLDFLLLSKQVCY